MKNPQVGNNMLLTVAFCQLKSNAVDDQNVPENHIFHMNLSSNFVHSSFALLSNVSNVMSSNDAQLYICKTRNK